MKLQANFFILCAVALMMAACGTTLETTEIDARPLDQRLAENSVSINKIKRHIHFLASDEMAGRDTPSEELKIAARYLASGLRGSGVQMAPGMESYMQNVPMKTVTPPTEGILVIGSDSLAINKDFIMLKGDNLELSSDMVYVNRGSEEDYEGLDVEGKVVVALCGYEGENNPQQWFFSGQSKRETAQKMGAAGLVEVYNSQQLPFSFLVQFLGQPQTGLDNDDEEDGTFPHLWMNTSAEKAIKDIKEKDLAGKIMMAGKKEEKFNSANVVGIVEGTDPELKDEYVIYSAHYDHVGVGRAVNQDSIYNGARDNAVGSTTVLLAADNIGAHPMRRSALFIFFTGEEKGLLGSAYYADNPVIPLDQVAYCFNSDNAGYNDTSRASIIGLTRTTAQPLIEKACSTFGLKAMEDGVPEQNLFDRSDNVNFAAKGVPAPTFSLGYSAFDEEINKYYHQPADEPESLDYQYLNKFFKSYLYASRLIGNTDARLFWTEGDKYYDMGVELYGSDKKMDGGS